MIITVCGQKGGTGKSTTAIAVAVEWASRGRRVLLVDADPQGTVRTWGDRAAEERAESSPAVIAVGVALERHVPPHAPHYDVIIVDCPPQHGELQRASLMIAHVAILPAHPDPTEVWGLTASANLVHAAMTVRPALIARVLVTRKDRRTVAGSQARSTLERLGLDVLDTELSRRVTYPDSLGAGRGPTTYDPRSSAAVEVRRLCTELEAFDAAAPNAPTRRRKAAT